MRVARACGATQGGEAGRVRLRRRSHGGSRGRRALSIDEVVRRPRCRLRVQRSRIVGGEEATAQRIGLISDVQSGE